MACRPLLRALARLFSPLARPAPLLAGLALLLGLIGWAPSACADDGHRLGEHMAIWTCIPFVLLLGAIAILPLFAQHWWEHNRNKAMVSLVLSLPVAIYLSSMPGGPEKLGHTLFEYVSFIVLLGALFIIAGGILIRGSFSGTPLVNTGALAIGAVIASFIGTTGASMLLIRPVLRANRHRTNKAHIVIFFIFLVSNVGGTLTPLGDPPLFLGFLQGVPFHWTFRLFPEWITVVLALLLVFNAYDQYVFHKEDVATPGDLDQQVESRFGVEIDGKINFLFLLGVIGAVLLAGAFREGLPHGTQEALMIAMALLSLKFTSRQIRAENGFTWGPIVEVAVLFVGIFVTMIPALVILNVRGASLGVTEPWQYFWATGMLSSVLDNAPTYLTFLSLAQGSGLANEVVGVSHAVLAAISCGAVFMGANTYIGNGPNFMVKAIAEEAGVKMPSFFGYMAYSGAILIPVFVAITLLFFR